MIKGWENTFHGVEKQRYLIINYIFERLPVRVLMIFAFSLLSAAILWGCAGTERGEGMTVNGFAFNTTYSIHVYEGGDQQTLDECVRLCSTYEGIFSRTAENSELYQMNEIERLYGQFKDEESIRKHCQKGSKTVFEVRADGSLACEISQDLHDIIEKGLYYAQKSNGLFDITIAPVSSLWEFTGENPSIPQQEALEAAVQRVSYRNILLEDGKLVFKEPGMALDLGGIAKGFIADKLKEYLTEHGVKSGLINLGGNVLCIGKKPDGTPFKIGIQQPFADRNETVASVQSEDMSVVSSGIYERYFKGKDGRLYHHILNPETGFPFDNDLMAVTILSEKSVDGDGLSTTCFSLGMEQGMALIDATDGVEAMFITKDEKIQYSKGWRIDEEKRSR